MKAHRGVAINQSLEQNTSQMQMFQLHRDGVWRLILRFLSFIQACYDVASPGSLSSGSLPSETDGKGWSQGSRFCFVKLFWSKERQDSFSPSIRPFWSPRRMQWKWFREVDQMETEGSAPCPALELAFLRMRAYHFFNRNV